MGPATALLLASLTLVSDGQPRVRIEDDGTPAARYAAEVLYRGVLERTAVALPRRGSLPVLRLATDAEPGYRIRIADKEVRITGDDPARAIHDLLAAWGPQRCEHLAVDEQRVTPARRLWIEADAFDPELPARGLVVRGLARYDAQAVALARELGYGVRVVSESFDDFLPPARFEEHPEWFALRQGERVPRGNFALTNADARRAFLDGVGAWLERHPEVDALGLWPEVTIAWDEESIAMGTEEAYALLWREAAARWPDLDIGILATGATLRPPAGPVPGNVSVRLRPGRDASALQGLEGQPVEAVVRAWEARGARVVLEIDGQPESWCGMPWPVEGALVANARRFQEAVLVRGTPRHARLWRGGAPLPPRSPAWDELERRARAVATWGDPADASPLFGEPLPDPPEEDAPRWRIAATIAAMERLRAFSEDAARGEVARRAAATEAWRTWRALEERMAPGDAATLRRYRERGLRAVVERLLPDGVVDRVGPALVRDAFSRTTVETDRLRLGIDRASGAIDHVEVRLADGWSGDLAGPDGRVFRVASPGIEAAPVGDSLRVVSPAPGELRIELGGTLGAGGPRWETLLLLVSASGRVVQTARVEAPGGVACACRLPARPFDRWLCPPYATEGALDGREGPQAQVGLPPGALLYLRRGERGPGLAMRLPDGGYATVVDGEAQTLLATTRGARLRVEWTFFTAASELAR